MNSHIDTFSGRMFVVIRSKSSNSDFVSDKVTTQIMISLVLSYMDFCNSLLAGLSGYQIHKLQRVQN